MNIDNGVRTHHPDYDKRFYQWKKMRDLMEGEDKIKEAGEDYLPRPSQAKNKWGTWDDYELQLYEAFKERAPFTNYFAQIHDCLYGMLEFRPVKIDVPQSIKNKKFLDNIDLQGNSAAQLFSDIDNDTLITGRGGILIDLPKVSPDISEAEAEELGARPYMAYYNAESIINWKYGLRKGVKTLIMVTLEEEVDDTDSLFSHKKKKQYRVLLLNEKGIYCQMLYQTQRNENGQEVDVVVQPPKPVLIKGYTINYIPFVTLPYTDPVKPILYDIGNLNIHHYQVAADYRNGSHLTSRPTLWFTGHEPEVDEETGEPLPVDIGADVVWQIPEPEAKVGVCTFSGEGIEHLERGLDRLESQIITLASHIISPEKKTAENKDTVALHRQGEDAKLASYGRYNSYRFTQAMKIWCEFCGCTEDELMDVKVELNTDYSQIAFDANAVNAIANIFSQGKLPLRCLYYLLHSGGYLEPDMTYEDFVYLLDLEASSLNPQEVDEAYKLYKKKGEKKQLNTGDWYSSQDLYKEKEGETSMSSPKDKEGE